MDSYDFLNKHLYRRKREIAIDRMLSKPKALRRVAYLDTKEALDTISYLERGYQAKNLWAINRNPAELAHLTMKLNSLGLPNVNTVGLDFEEALERRVPEVDVIDFDGMGCLHWELHRMFNWIVTSRPNAVYGLTILAGRENPKEATNWFVNVGLPDFRTEFRTSFGKQIKATHAIRLWTLLNLAMSPGGGCFGDPSEPLGDKEYEQLLQKNEAVKSGSPHKRECIAHITKMVWDVYTSTSGQPMLWCVCNVEPHQPITHYQLGKYMRATAVVHETGWACSLPSSP